MPMLNFVEHNGKSKTGSNFVHFGNLCNTVIGQQDAIIGAFISDDKIVKNNFFIMVFPQGSRCTLGKASGKADLVEIGLLEGLILFFFFQFLHTIFKFKGTKVV